MDLLGRQVNDLLMLPYNRLFVITSFRALMDKKARRWVFNRFPVLREDDADVSDTVFVYVDTRVLDEQLTGAMLNMMERRMSTAKARREVVQLGPGKANAIVDAMGRLAEVFVSGLEAGPEAYLSQIVDSINTVVRTDRPELVTFEVILKS
jgi:hypothetical protein